MGINKDKSMLTAAAELRRHAEARLSAKTAELHPSRTVEETQRLLHELQVHQIELEMQNSELRHARGEVETALGKYSDLFEFAPVSYLILDRNGTIRAANLSSTSLLGVEHSRLIDRRFGQFVADETRLLFADFLGKVFTSPAKEACEVALLKEENSPFFVQIEAVAAASGQECRIALIDITERKRTEEALRQAIEAAEATARLKSQFLTNMSHELRTPMNGILCFLQLALDEDLAPVPREYLKTTLSSARSLLRILNDILDMAKIEAGKLTIEEKPFSLPLCVTEVIDIITPEVRRKGLDFILSVTEEVPDTVVGDQVRLRQVLTNLIDNAVKFTEEGKVVVQVSAGATTSDGRRDFTITVTDTGIGIPDDKKGLIFSAFSQVDASHSRRYGGTGLGLAISSEIVELMEGTISFNSTERVGSTFSFTIPLRETRLEVISLSAAEFRSPEKVAAQEGERIPRLLIAEDDPANRMAFGLLLKRLNYNIDFAEDGLEAVNMWEKGEYDLVLMDIQMPRLDGFEATRAIREKEHEHGGHTPIVAITAHAYKKYEEICLASGMDAYISKPIDFNKLLLMMGQIIKQKSSNVY